MTDADSRNRARRHRWLHRCGGGSPGRRGGWRSRHGRWLRPLPFGQHLVGFAQQVADVLRQRLQNLLLDVFASELLELLPLEAPHR